MLSFINPMLVTLGVDCVKLGIHVGLSDEQDEVALRNPAAIVLRDVLYGGQVILAHLNVVVLAELQVLRDAENSRLGGVRSLKYF